MVSVIDAYYALLNAHNYQVGRWTPSISVYFNLSQYILFDCSGLSSSEPAGYSIDGIPVYYYRNRLRLEQVFTPSKVDLYFKNPVEVESIEPSDYAIAYLTEEERSNEIKEGLGDSKLYRHAYYSGGAASFGASVSGNYEQCLELINLFRFRDYIPNTDYGGTTRWDTYRTYTRYNRDGSISDSQTDVWEAGSEGVPYYTDKMAFKYEGYFYVDQEQLSYECTTKTIVTVNPDDFRDNKGVFIKSVFLPLYRRSYNNTSDDGTFYESKVVEIDLSEGEKTIEIDSSDLSISIKEGALECSSSHSMQTRGRTEFIEFSDIQDVMLRTGVSAPPE